MTEALTHALNGRSDVQFRHVNTQVSRSLSEKGGRHQLRKSLCAGVQAARVCWQLLRFKADALYLPLTNSPSFLGFLRDGALIALTYLARKRVLVRLHGGYYFYAHTGGLRRALVERLLRRVSLAMVQGQGLVGCFNGIIPGDRIVVIPNGLDGRPFDEARLRLRAGKAVPERTVLFVGLMCREKGFRDVLEAIPRVQGATFVFAGEWPSPAEEADVRRLLAARDLLHRVEFAGVVTGRAKYDLFVQASIFVFPTYFPYEGHAVSSVEALAAGLPIVCTDHGALSESVRDGWNGYFVPKQCPSAIAARLSELLSDSDLRDTMGRRSRELFDSRFRLGMFADNWVRAVRACLCEERR